MATIPTLKMNTGATVPAIGLGCWAGVDPKDRENAKAWFLTALKAGYRRFDTAYFYGTEKALGLAIKESGIPREEIFVTTKLAPHQAGTEEAAIKESLADLGLDYVDLYLIHCPQVFVNENNNPVTMDENGNIKIRRDYHFTQTWAAMEKIYVSGKAKAIGVSNFSIKNIEILLKNATVVPADNQVESHPYLVQDELVQYCKNKGIMVTAYAPTGYANVRSDPLISELAKKYAATPTQIVLAWHLARGVGAVPCSKDPKHQAENLVLPTLEAEDVKRISTLDKGMRLSLKPDDKGHVQGWTLEEMGW